MANNIENIKINYYEIEFGSSYSMVIKGVRKPTKKEAALFLENDMSKLNETKVVKVLSISKEEAYSFFDMEFEKDFPIFGIDTNNMKVG